MILPNGENAVIDPRKLRDYVLSAEHSVGRFKAAYFIKLGFTSQRWKRLDLELRRLALREPAEIGEKNEFGQKYVVRGTITSPTGKSAWIVTVWIILNGEQLPRLVTMYPEV